MFTFHWSTMAWVLRAAILCGALWVCCTSLLPPPNPPAIRTTATANTPSVTANTPSVTANTPLVTANTPLVTANTPSVTANTPTVTANTPSVTADTPPVTADTPPVTANTPSMTANTSPVTANTPSVTADTPPVTADTPPVTANTPSMTANTSPVTVNTPSVTANTPSMTVNTSPVTVNTPSVTANTPPVTANTPPVTANTSPVTVNTPSVTANTPPVTANTPPVTANTPSVTANTPSVTFEQIRGLRTLLEGDRIVFEVKTDLLADCVAGKRLQEDFDQLKAEVRSSYVYLNSRSTSHVMRGTLKLDLRSDDVTPTPDTENVVKKCYIAIHKEFDDDFTIIKVVKFEVSPGDIFQVDILPYYGSTVSYSASMERPELIRVNKLDLCLQWRSLPETVSVEIEYTILDRIYAEWPIKNTTRMKGVMTTPFWDGISAYQGVNAILAEAPSGVIEVPAGHRTMVSWEHMGVGDYTSCNLIMVNILDGNSSVGFEYCGGTPPPPRLVAWPRVEVRIGTLFDDTHRAVVFTGVSLRFSFHDASAGLLPQQLPDKTWNCSVAHWPDFSDHLLCDLVTQCAGGEDEADCPYTPRGGTTCRHGDLAAGGSCFTFDLLEDWTSWYEAQAACRSRGARLPTLNTPAKWRAVLDLLSHRSWDNIYIGLTSGDSRLPDLYSDFLQWTDSTVAYYVKAAYLPGARCGTCAFLKNNRGPGILYMDSCARKVAGSLLCEVMEGPSNPTAIALARGIKEPPRINSTVCPNGHVTHNFLSCDPDTDCWDGCYTAYSAPHASLPPAFLCHNGFERVPFTLLCDHREDCTDASDEICVLPPCQEFECDNKQCIANKKTCDGAKNCLDGSDEIFCSRGFDTSTFDLSSLLNFSKQLPAMVLHDGKGLYELLDLDLTSSDIGSALEGCPDSHFQCPGVSYYCLPVYVRCNGVYDCPEYEDEADCDIFHCIGLYRCRGSKICLHSEHVCDGVFQCPQRDDELMCGLVCPVGCTCYGLAFFCTVPFDASRHAGLRFLDASGSGMDLKGLSNNFMLFYLKLARCNVTQLENMRVFNLFHLDLSENSIATLTEKHIFPLHNLNVFVIAGNPLRRILEDSTPGQGAFFAKLHTLDLSAATITAAQMVNLHVFSNVINLNLSNTGLDAVSGFSVFSKLRVLDLRGCPVTYFPRSVFQGLDDLSTVYADNYKLCCQVTLPIGFNTLNCHAPFDEVSSCEGLLKSGLYRVGLSVLTSMTLMGNAGSFVYRVFINRPKQQSSFGLFVTNLCLSDFLMGVYSAIIGIADRLYMNKYVWKDFTWRRSVTCKLAGFLSLVSNEVSVLIICLITVDRFLVTRFPFSLHLHFSPRSARVACVTSWSIGILLAVSPLLPVTSHWQLYSQTGICIPLPVTRRAFAGRDYSFGILIILNFVLFLVIASGQMSIYLSIRANSMTTSDSNQKAKDLTIARRLITVAVSDFLCWFPVGLLGMLSSRGLPIPGEANVVIAVFVLPLNSALNPFLYTVNVILERRQRAREQRLLKILLARHGVATARREGDGSK